MVERTDGLKLWMPANYRIKVQGAVDERYSDLLGSLTISPVNHADEAPVTVLQGQLRDQAALFGVLNTLYNSMHLPLLLVERVESGEEINKEVTIERPQEP